MASYNRVILVGNITRDIEIKYLQSGTAVTEVGLAMNKRYKDKNEEWVDKAIFVDVTMWGRQAEIASEYLHKGSPILVEGELDMDQWDDKETGKKRSKLKVVCKHMTMLGTKNSEGRGGGGDDAYSEPATHSASKSNQQPDEVPF